MNTIQLVIFDMDGLMFETGRLAYRAYLKSAEEHDFELIHGLLLFDREKRSRDSSRNERVVRRCPCRPMAGFDEPIQRSHFSRRKKSLQKARFARFTKGAEAAHLPNRISLLFFPRKNRHLF